MAKMAAQSILRTQTEFIADISRRVLEKSIDKNVVFSPLCVSAALCMAAEYGNTVTTSQIKKLCFKMKSNQKFDHKAILGYICKELFTGAGMSLGGSYPCFSATSHVDKWDEDIMEACKKNEEEMARLLNMLYKNGEEAFQMTFKNSLDFLGKWKKQVDQIEGEDDFHLLNGETVKVPTVTTTGPEYVMVVDGCKILKLPFERGHDRRQFSMYIVLPDQIDGLPSLVDRIDAEFLKNNLVPGERVVTKTMLFPTMTMEYQLSAKEVLQEMGLVLPFMDIAGGDHYTAAIEHKATLICFNFPKVAEDGASTSSTRRTESFIADHPFMFFVKEEKTGIIFLVGQVVDP